jgi:hypothetical protein
VGAATTQLALLKDDRTGPNVPTESAKKPLT